jgi:hypothetical protein
MCQLHAQTNRFLVIICGGSILGFEEEVRRIAEQEHEHWKKPRLNTVFSGRHMSKAKIKEQSIVLFTTCCCPKEDRHHTRIGREGGVLSNG